MSMNEIIRSSESTIWPGSSPAMILQKMQSGSFTRGSLSLLHRLPREQLARPLDRLVGRGDLAGEACLLELGQHATDLWPRLQADGAGELVAADRRAWPIGTPGQRLPKQLARELEVPR